VQLLQVLDRAHVEIVSRARDTMDGFAAIINADAGAMNARRRVAAAEALRRRLRIDGARLIIADGADLGEAAAEIARQSPRAVLAIGGDGTARTMIETLTPLGIACAPLPGGTLNRFSRALYGRVRMDDLLHQIKHGQAAWAPAGRVGDHRFYVVSGYGAPMRLNRLREHVRARRVGAVWQAWRAIGEDMFNSPIAVDGREATCAIVALGPIDSAFGLSAPAQRDALEIARASWRHMGEAIGLAPFALLGGWRTRRGVDAYIGARVALSSSTQTLPALLDGEPFLLPPRCAIQFEPRAGLVWR
jgi:hypothetical protein